MTTWRCSVCGVPQDASQDYCHEARPASPECDCGKGEWCPQYGSAFLAAEAKTQQAMVINRESAFYLRSFPVARIDGDIVFVRSFGLILTFGLSEVSLSV